MLDRDHVAQISRTLDVPGAHTLRLSHQNADGGQTRVATVQISDVSALAAGCARLWAAAVDHAEIFTLPQVYVFAAVDDIGAVLGHYLARIAGGAQSELSPTESATAAGLVGQLMRHLEVQARTVQTVIGTTHKLLSAELIRAHERIAQLEAGHAAQREAVELAVQSATDREIARATQERSDARKDALVTQVQLMLPAAAGAIAAKIGLGNAAAPIAGVASARALFESLDEEQLKSMLSTMSPAQTAALWTAYKALAHGEPEESGGVQ